MKQKEYKGFIVSIDEFDEIIVINSHTNRRISPYLGSDGYIHVSRKENGETIRERLHRIIAICFIENPEGYRYINHIDSNKTNNHPSNLEWCSNSMNVRHGWDSGNRIHKNRTKVIAYDLNGNKIGNWTSIRKMSEELKIDRHRVARILKKEVNNHYPYIFEYGGSQSTIESIA